VISRVGIADAPYGHLASLQVTGIAFAAEALPSPPSSRRPSSGTCSGEAVSLAGIGMQRKPHWKHEAQYLGPNYFHLEAIPATTSAMSVQTKPTFTYHLFLTRALPCYT